MLPETLAYLRDKGLATGDQVDREELAAQCLGLLTARPVASADEGEIQEKALIVPELRFQIVGDPGDEELERDLDLLLTPLLGANGKVQKALENGYVLCAKQVTRKLGQNGEPPITITRRGRFVTDHPEAIELYFWAPAIGRLSSAAETVRLRLELGARRVPALDARRQTAINSSYKQLELELPRKVQP